MKSIHRARRPSPFEGIPPQVFLLAQTPYRHLHHRSQRIADQLREWRVPLTYVEESSGWRSTVAGRQGGLAGALGRSMKYHLAAAIQLPGHPGHIPVAEGKMDLVRLPLSVPIARFDSARLERLTASLFRQTMVRELFPRRISGLTSVALVNNPLWGLVLRKGDFDRVVYDCIDDVSLYAGLASPSRFQEYEQTLLQVCDAVITTAEPLESHVRGLDPRIPVFRIPNGVDVEWFQELASEGRALPDIDALSPTVVGYVGTISGWINLALVAEVATLLPAVTFLFVGPEEPWVSLEPLKRLANVRFVGPKAYEDIPSIIAACRICWIPVSGGRIVERTNPIKLYEYFALGKPVVSTPMPELEVYRRRGLLGIGKSAEEIVQAIQHALAEEDEQLVRRRVKVAREHSWDTLVAGLFRVLRGEV